MNRENAKLRREEGRKRPEMSVSKTQRFTPPDTARASPLHLVVYELLRLLEEAPPKEERAQRLRALRTRIPLLASHTDVSQALAEEDGDAVTD